MGPKVSSTRGLAVVGFAPVSWLRRYPIVVDHRGQHLARHRLRHDHVSSHHKGGLRSTLIEAPSIGFGAGAWKVFRFITLPLIRGPVFLFLLLTTITTASVFGLVYFLTRGGPGQATELVSVFIYERSFAFFQLGLGSAASVIMLVVVLILGLTYVRLAKVEV